MWALRAEFERDGKTLSALERRLPIEAYPVAVDIAPRALATIF